METESGVRVTTEAEGGAPAPEEEGKSASEQTDKPEPGREKPPAESSEDEELKKELEQLREENKILRESLTDSDKHASDEENRLQDLLREAVESLKPTLDQAKEQLRPGLDKLTEVLGCQMEENPVPLLLAAFGFGYLISRGLDRK